MIIYHIVLPETWANFSKEDYYEAESLTTEGFIHCSFDNQIDGVLQRYYQGVEKILILTIDSDKLTSELINEPSTANEIYPHIYGKINKDSIIGIEEKEL